MAVISDSVKLDALDAVSYNAAISACERAVTAISSRSVKSSQWQSALDLLSFFARSKVVPDKTTTTAATTTSSSYNNSNHDNNKTTNNQLPATNN